MRRDDICLYVSPANRSRLEAIMVDRNSSSKAVWRAEIVLATADGLGTNAIMKRTGKSKPCVWRWQERYIEEGVDGLLRDKTRPPGTKPLSAAIKREVLAKTASQTPPAATHWSVRTMAAEMGISHTSVQRIWAEAGLKPHLVSTFKISNDPQFELSDTNSRLREDAQLGAILRRRPREDGEELLEQAALHEGLQEGGRDPGPRARARRHAGKQDRTAGGLMMTQPLKPMTAARGQGSRRSEVISTLERGAVSLCE